MMNALKGRLKLPGAHTDCISSSGASLNGEVNIVGSFGQLSVVAIKGLDF